MEKSKSKQTAETGEVITVFNEVTEIPLLESWPPFPSDDILGGNPNGHRGSVLYREPSRRYSVGLWECPPAKFREAAPYAEFSHVLKGCATITDEKTGQSKTVRAGDTFFIAFKATVIWEIHETFCKLYAVYEDEWDEERFY